MRRQRCLPPGPRRGLEARGGRLPWQRDTLFAVSGDCVAASPGVWEDTAPLPLAGAFK